MGPAGHLRRGVALAGAGVLRAAGADALRELLRGDLAVASPTVAALSCDLFLLPLGGRSRRRNRRRASGARLACMVAQGIDAHFRGPAASSGDDCLARDGGTLPHPADAIS